MKSVCILPLAVLVTLGACDSSESSSAPASTAEVARTVVATRSTEPEPGPPDCSQATELASVKLESEDEVRVLETLDHRYLCLVGSDAEPTIALTDRTVDAPQEVGNGPLGASGWYHVFALPTGFPDLWWGWRLLHSLKRCAPNYVR